MNNMQLKSIFKEMGVKTYILENLKKNLYELLQF